MAGILPILSNLDDIAESIADPNPNRPFANAVGQQGRKICDAISNGPDWYTSGVGANQLANYFCTPYWNNEGISPPEFEPPFQGGQCEGTEYAVTGSITTDGVFCSDGSPVGSVTTNNLGAFVPNLIGPVSSIRPEVLTSSSCQGAGRDWGVRVIDQGGTRNRFFSVASGGTNRNYTSVSISPVLTPVSGPDDCGDPPLEVKPGPNPSPNNPFIPPEERPTDDPDRGPLLPMPDLPGSPGIPSLPIPSNPFGSLPVGPIPGDPGEPGEGVDADGEGSGGEGEPTVEGDAPPGTELVGLKLELNSEPLGGRQFAEGVYRAGCYVYMGTVAGLDQDPAGASIRSGQFVFAEKPGLTKWRVTANVGFSWRVTPFYREVE